MCLYMYKCLYLCICVFVCMLFMSVFTHLAHTVSWVLSSNRTIIVAQDRLSAGVGRYECLNVYMFKEGRYQYGGYVRC